MFGWLFIVVAVMAYIVGTIGAYQMMQILSSVDPQPTTTDNWIEEIVASMTVVGLSIGLGSISIAVPLMILAAGIVIGSICMMIGLILLLGGKKR